MGLFDIFRKKNISKGDSESEKTLKMCRKAVEIYGDFMNSPNFPEAGFVADTSKLPIDKETLKFALKRL